MTHLPHEQPSASESLPEAKTYKLAMLSKHHELWRLLADIERQGLEPAVTPEEIAKKTKARQKCENRVTDLLPSAEERAEYEEIVRVMKGEVVQSEVLVGVHQYSQFLTLEAAEKVFWESSKERREKSSLAWMQWLEGEIRHHRLDREITNTLEKPIDISNLRLILTSKTYEEAHAATFYTAMYPLVRLSVLTRYRSTFGEEGTRVQVEGLKTAFEGVVRATTEFHRAVSESPSMVEELDTALDQLQDTVKTVEDQVCLAQA